MIDIFVHLVEDEANVSASGTIYGSFRYADGSEYIGEWDSKGQRHGVGQLTTPDGSVYVGQFQAGLASGLGVLVFTDGARCD